MLQETHSTNLVEKRWRNEWGGRIWFSHGSSKVAGVAVLIEKNFPFQIADVIRDDEGRMVIIRGKYHEEKIIFASIYGPNKDSPEFFEAMFRRLDATGVDRKIVAGDFNAVLNNETDRSTGTHRHVKSTEVLNLGIDELYLRDVWTVNEQPHPGYIWRRKLANSVLSERLDYMLVSESVVQFLDEIKVAPGFRTDHSMLCAEMEFNCKRRGPGYWKFNTSLLRDKDFLQSINNLLDIELGQSNLYDSKRQQWEVLKLTLRNSIIQYSTHRARSNRNKLEVLERKLQYWQQEGDDIKGPFKKVEDRISEIQQEINNLIAIKTQCAVLRCRTDWQNYAERPTKYFLNLEKANFNRKTIHRLKNSAGKIIDDPKQVQQELTQFYRKLYASEEQGNLDYISNLKAPVLSAEQKSAMEKPIELIEIGRALRDLKSSKAPGVDGIPPEFYKVFWRKLKHFILELFQEIVEEGELHLSARRGIIALIEKTGKDPLLIENWRPISLLCSDYKIYAKVLANRMQLTLDHLIDSSQTGFVKGRNIAQNIMFLQNIMEFCQSKQKSAIIISFDFRKAFDTVHWEAIYGSLSHFGFGNKFLQMIKVLYKNPMSCVLNNGYWGDFFPLQRSTRQGDPASSIIFLYVVEILGLKIRQNVKIEGLNMFGFDMRTLQYADDLCVVIQPKAEVLNELLLEMERFYRFSGLNINYEKTIAYKLGPCRDSDATFVTIRNIAWTNEPVKILGIWFHPSLKRMMHENFTSKIDKVKAILNVWKTRKLTLMGRIAIVNTLIISQFTYQFSALPTPPETFFKEMKSVILEYIWEGKPHRLRYEKLIQNYDKGGLKLVDLKTKNTALKARWPVKFQESQIPCVYGFFPISDHRIWLCNIEEKHIKRLKLDSVLMQDIWLAWLKIYFHIPETEEEIANQMLWGNSLILRAGMPIFNKKLVNSNIEFMDNLVDGKGFRSFEDFTNIERQEVDIMLLNSVKSAIPNMWKKILDH